ncbi:synaptotagmin-like protein 3 [Clupea harengus]|uniref:Synaptotagmin-like protein 3 n=1 Tax=Clupea harengus TaxID=7950 RepID=A0A6P8GF01_CLUHA|nr:synaptotagmin-like protein 3 [Clupea harengus]XP_042565860.1 synaptotagmin-like protein 3 [Clupea harengus]
MDLSLLQALEREKVLEVLQRDKTLRSVEEDRIRRLKLELQELRRRGAKSFCRQYSERTCARCQRPLGKFWNSGAVCRGCSHRICSKCRVCVSPHEWKCTVCHAYRDVKIKSGEWFMEERAKKFPRETDKHDTIGEILLRSYQRLSYIAIVPPTPPPVQNVFTPPFNRLSSWKNSKGSPKPFTKSMEDLMMSFTTRIKKISKSQEDVRAEPDLLTVEHGSIDRSQSDTAINISANQVPCFQSLFKRSKEQVQERRRSSSALCGDEDTSQSSGYSGEKRGSSSSTSTDCGLIESSGVTGELELALAYSFSSSCFEVVVGACRNLTHGDTKKKKCHPYVKVYLLPDKSQSTKMKTAVIKNTTDPIFQETLQRSIARELLASRTLQASVWHSETLRRKVFLGEVLIPLDSWRFEDSSTQGLMWYPLCPKTEQPQGGSVEQVAGELLLRVKFSSLTQICKLNSTGIGPYEVGQFTVVIIGVQNLSSSKHTSSFIKGCLALPGEREMVQRTPVVKKGPSPAQAHQLTFSRVTPHELQDASLQLEVWEHAPFSVADKLQGTATLHGGLLWQPLQQAPNVWHSVSLPLRANINNRKP